MYLQQSCGGDGAHTEQGAYALVGNMTVLKYYLPLFLLSLSCLCVMAITTVSGCPAQW